MAAIAVPETVDDLTRIMALPRRPPVVCEIDPKTGNYPPATQALIEVETAKFSRGKRISCACRPRMVRLHEDGRTLSIFRVLPAKMPPAPPIYTTKEAFLADNQTPGDMLPAAAVKALLPGQEVMLAATDSEIGHPCITELSPPQAWFLREAAQENGAVGFLGVGSGKTIIFLLSALLFPDSRLAVAFIEPKQRQHYRSQYLLLREHFRVSSIVSEVEIPGSTVPGTTPLHLLSYSIVSRTSDMLDRLEPDVVMIDEAHHACGKSAINRRVKRYAEEQIKKREAAILAGKPVRARAVRYLSGSGTLEVKRVNDTQMLCAFSLGTGSPLPVDPNVAEAWSYVFDDSYKPDRTSLTAQRLLRAFGGGWQQDPNAFQILGTPEKEIRDGFRHWRQWTPGIITASASDIDASIKIDELETPEMPRIVKDALANVRVNNLRPDGEWLEEVVEQLAVAKNVASGFYLYWAFPKHPCACPKDQQDISERCEECQLIENWYSRRKAYKKESRTVLAYGMLHLDSDKLCEEAAERARKNRETKHEVYCHHCLKKDLAVAWPCPEKGHLPAWQSKTWADWREIKDKVDYEERVKWLGHGTKEADDPETHPGYFLARYVAEYAKEHECVVWFQSVPLGRKIAELSGLPYFNGGPGGEERLRAEKGDRSVICSISAHGAGTDGLQLLFDEQVIVEVPPSNATSHGLEQILGRLHRRGQTADEVYTRVCLHAYEFKDALRKAIQQAEWNYEMQKTKQKLLSADIAIDDL